MHRSLALSVVAAIVVAACQAATPSAAPVSSTATPAPTTAAPTATASPTSAPTPSPTEEPTEEPTASPDAGPTTGSTGECTVDVDPAPALNVQAWFTGEGFEPGVDLEVTFTGPPSGTSSFGGPEGDIQPSMLRVQSDGTFGPWDVTYNQPEEVGEQAVTFSDGECSATIAFTVE